MCSGKNNMVIQPDLIADPAPVLRKASREARRAQLIEATIETLSQRGFARTTLTDVAKQAGLSHGLVNFHFETKEKLLGETLRHLYDEYSRNWQQALADAPKDPASQLDAMLRADFNDSVGSPQRLAAWCAFWGEAQSRPLYQQLCAPGDQRYTETVRRLCASLIAKGRYDLDPERVARVLRVASDGLWLELMSLAVPYSMAEARTTLYTCATAFFPRHFTADGLIAGVAP